MPHLNKKGSIVFALFAVIMVSLTLIGSLNIVMGMSKLSQDTQDVKNYYLALGGLRYASMLLNDPDSLTFVGDRYQVTGLELGGNLYGDLAADGGHLVITIDRTGIAPDYLYEIRASAS